MHNLILFDDDIRTQLLPLTYTRPVAEIRIGILTIKEKWEKWLGVNASYITQDYLSTKYPMQVARTNWVVNASVLPTARLSNIIADLELNEAVLLDGELIATKLDDAALKNLLEEKDIDQIKGYELEGADVKRITQLADLTRYNEEELISDYEMVCSDRKSASIPSHVRVTERSSIFIEPGARLGHCILNATDGPIYIGADAQIADGAILQGCVSIGAGSKVKMAARIAGPTTIGPVCSVGGEISRSIMIGYSNKGHDGFLGDSVLGEWCNLGADTNNSNLKNNYAEVRLWNYAEERFVPTGQQFVGLFMGDHSKCGINTMWNTGTVVGVSANVYGGGYQKNFVPSFSWGGPPAGLKTYKLDKALEVAEIVMARRDLELGKLDRSILSAVYERSAAYRSWEKANP